MQEGLDEQKCDDGLLEIMGLKDGWHSAFVLLEVSTAVRLCQVSALTFLEVSFLSHKEESNDLVPMLNGVLSREDELLSYSLNAFNYLRSIIHAQVTG